MLRIRPWPGLRAAWCVGVFAIAAGVIGGAQTRAAAPAKASVAHTFVYVSPTKLESVNLAGTFNKWSMTATPMKPNAAHTTWRIRMRLAPGNYEYKFVLNGKTWKADPKAKSEGSYGNSVLVIG